MENDVKNNGAVDVENVPIVDRNGSESKRVRRAIYNILIVLAIGVGFGKIAAVDSVYDRAIQNFRLQQIPKKMEEKAKELQTKDAAPERMQAELERVYNALLADANKARPTLCANDRSRWATIRALVEPEMRVYRYAPLFTEEQKRDRIQELQLQEPNSAYKVGFKYYPNEILRNCSDDCPEKFTKENCTAKRYTKTLVPYAVDKVWETPGWDSIDVVKHGLKDEVYKPEDPSSGYIYSSKPTLLPTVMAAPYWVLHNVFGLSLAKNPFEGVKILLVFYNLIPLGIAFLCLTSLIDSVGKTLWGRVFAVAALLFGSFALTFVATLNNHIPGFAAISIALWAGMKILREGKDSWIYYALAGFFGAFAVVCELPALAFAGILFLCLVLSKAKKTLAVAVPFGLVVAAAFVATDYIAHQSLMPAYSHKRDHMALKAQAEAKMSAEAKEKNEAPNFDFDPNDWYYYVYYPAGKPREMKNARLSHWANRTGIDRGEPSVARYAFHSTIGSRGVFSLAPVWIFSIIGAVLFALTKGRTDPGKRALGIMTLVLTVVFFAFFMTRDQGDRNYGGVCCYPRWFFPLIPLFVPAIVPVADALSKRAIGRWIAYLALFIAAASAAYPTWSPWVSPWFYQFAVEWNWMKPY